MEQEIFDIVKSSSLAHGMTDEDVRALLASSQVRRRSFAKGGIVFRDGEQPRGLYLLLSGTLVIKKDTFSGRQIFLSEVSGAGEMFGEVYEVLGRPYDMYVEAATRAEVLEISSSLFSLAGGDLSRPALCVQRSLMHIFAQKAYYMHSRIQVLASGTLREKIVRFLAEHLDEKGTARLTESRETLAAYFAVARPSLSRELGAMAHEGILEVDGRIVHVCDLARFESYL